MIIKPCSIVSLESVAVQKDTLLYMEMKGFFQKLIDGKDAKFAELDEIVRRKTKMLAHFVVNDDPTINAYVVPPMMDKNNPLLDRWMRMWNDQSAARSVEAWTRGKEAGWLDRKNSMVYGFFQKLPFQVTIHRGCFDSKRISAGGLAMIVLHEIGHVWSMFEAIAMVDSSCVILRDFVRGAMAIEEPELRVRFVDKFNKENGTHIANDKTLLTDAKEPELLVLAYQDLVESGRDEFGSTIYDMRTWESLSDQFAARHGDPVELAQALSILLSNNYDDRKYFRGNFLFYFMEVLKTLFIAISLAGNIVTLNFLNVFLITAMLSMSPFERRYDKPKERIGRLREELISRMKEKGLPKEISVRLDADVKMVDDLLKDINNNDTFFEKFWLMLSPWTRAQKRKTETLKDIQALFNNDLFVEANKLNSLQGK